MAVAAAATVIRMIPRPATEPQQRRRSITGRGDITGVDQPQCLPVRRERCLGLAVVPQYLPVRARLAALESGQALVTELVPAAAVPEQVPTARRAGAAVGDGRRLHVEESESVAAGTLVVAARSLLVREGWSLDSRRVGTVAEHAVLRVERVLGAPDGTARALVAHHGDQRTTGWISWRAGHRERGGRIAQVSERVPQ